MHPINMKWILEGFNVRSTINRHTWSRLPFVGCLSQKKVDQIATEGFSNLLIRQAVQIYH